jgi:hypothetical protein
MESARNLPPNGGVVYPPVVNVPRPGASQQQSSYYEDTATLRIDQPGHPASHAHNLYHSGLHPAQPVPESGLTPQQLQDYYLHRQQFFSQQQQAHYNHRPQPTQQQPVQQPPHQPTNPTRPPAYDDHQEYTQHQAWQQQGRSSSDDVDMPDSAPEPVAGEEAAKQPTSGGMGTAAPPSPTDMNYGGRAPDSHSTASMLQGGYEQGISRSSRQLGGVCSTQGSYDPHTQQKKKQSIISNIMNTIGLGPSSQVSAEQNDAQNRESAHVSSLKRENENIEKSNQVLREALRKKESEFQSAKGQLRTLQLQLDSQSRNAKARFESAVKEHDHKVAAYAANVADYKARMNDYKATADKLSLQLSTLEQTNSKQVGGTGAHKDSHAIPPNLVKSATVVGQAALACTKASIIFLKERNAFETHEAVRSLPKGSQDDVRYKRHAVEAYICSRLFAGFENDSYMDSLDCSRASPYLPKETDFFLQNQDLEKRYERYLGEYNAVQKLGLQGIMDKLKHTDKNPSHLSPFLQFCCRKLVSVMIGVDKFATEFPPSGDYSEHSLLLQLATNSMYCDKFLKPFVNLAMAAFLLHRLAFQFHPPARIFRYAQGTKFDQTYMENAVPIDDDDSEQELVVGLMVIPGFQVGATIIKCVVYLVPSVRVTAPAGDQAKEERR